MKNKETKTILWATQGIISSLRNSNVKADITLEEYDRMLEISNEAYGEFLDNDSDLIADSQKLLRELLDEVLGGK